MAQLNSTSEHFMYFGAVCITLGILGLFRQLLPYLLVIPFGVWLNLSLLLLGWVALTISQISVLLASGNFHQIPGQFLSRQMQVGQRLYILANLASPSREDVESILSGVSPFLARVVVAKDLQEVCIALQDHLTEAFPVLANLQRIVPVSLLIQQDSVGQAEAGPEVKTEDVEQVQKLPTSATDALAWLKRPQLLLGLEEQLQLYGLAKQATAGDVAESEEDIANTSITALESAKSTAWSHHHGLSRVEASEKLVEQLCELDPLFRRRKHEVSCNSDQDEDVTSRQLVVSPVRSLAASSTISKGLLGDTPGGDFIRLAAELLMHRLPSNMDETIVRTRRRMLVLCVAFATFRLLLQRHNLSCRRWSKLPLVSAMLSIYLFVLTFGLPASIQLRMPRAIRELPANTETAVEKALGSGASASLARWAVQLLLPPLSRPLLNE